MRVTKDIIKAGLVDLGLKNKRVEVHSSLSSFGTVIDGASSVVAALVNVCDTVIVPTYSYEMYMAKAPQYDRPIQNGLDYSNFDKEQALLGLRLLTRRRGLRYIKKVLVHAKRLRKERRLLCKSMHKSWTTLGYIQNRVYRRPFDPDFFCNESFVNEDIGQIPETMLTLSGTIRSPHPTVSWAGYGSDAEYYLKLHPPDNPLLPIRKLYEDDGFVVLLGVPLHRCTALHISEEMVGRRPFIRWVLYSDGTTRRVRQNGCIGGAPNFELAFARFGRRARIGLCNAIALPIRKIVDLGARIIRRSPEITLCSEGKGCEECIDASKGGPIEKL